MFFFLLFYEIFTTFNRIRGEPSVFVNVYRSKWLQYADATSPFTVVSRNPIYYGTKPLRAYLEFNLITHAARIMHIDRRRLTLSPSPTGAALTFLRTLACWWRIIAHQWLFPCLDPASTLPVRPGLARDFILTSHALKN